MLHRGRNLGRHGEKGQCPLVHHPVENHAQRVNVHRWAIGLMFGDLRSHIAGRTGNRAGAIFHGYLRDTKVPQLENPVLGNQNVFRLDVPVDDVFFFAGGQGGTQVFSYGYNSLFAVFRGQYLFQRSQQLHADIQIPADAVLVLNIAQIQTVDDIGAAAEPLHHTVLAHQIFQLVGKVRGDACLVKLIGTQFFNFIRISWKRQLFQCAFFNLAVRQGALNFVHASEAAYTQLADDFPAGPYNIRESTCHALFLPSAPVIARMFPESGRR